MIQAGKQTARTDGLRLEDSDWTGRTDGLRFEDSDWTGRTAGYGTVRRTRWVGSWPVWFLKPKNAIFMSFYESKH